MAPRGAMPSWRRSPGKGVHGLDFMRHRVAHHIEPQPAALYVAPTFQVQPLGILPEKQIPPPLLIARAQVGARAVRRPAANEFILVARTAADTWNLHHEMALPAASARSRKRPLRRSAAR